MSGIELSRDYWHQVVRPILDECRPDMPRAAARLGTGSDVLGLDDGMSRDHDWGLRLQLFVPTGQTHAVNELLTERLPDEFAGHPTSFAFSGQDDAQLAMDVTTVEEFAHATLGFDPRDGVSVADWLSVSGQSALEVTAGAVFDDTDGALTRLRQVMRYWPEDVRPHVIACDWQRIDQELPLMARAGDRGDELGSRVIAARLVDAAMHLGFALCRRWAPYAKWRGTLFARLRLPEQVAADLRACLQANDWHDRNSYLAGALEQLAQVQAQTGLPSAHPVCVPFWDRPYLQIDQELVARLTESIADERIRALPAGLGAIDQRTANVDLLTHPERRRRMTEMGAGR